MLIRTDRLTIRNIRASDWRSLKWIWDDFSKTEYAQYDRPHQWTDEETKALAESVDNNRRYHAVCIGDTMIGYIRFKNLDPNGCEFGYCFHSESHGHGYAKEALFALLDAYVHTYGIEVFTAGTGLNNTPSVRFLEACGFVLTGTEKVSFYKDVQGNDIFFDGGVFEKRVDMNNNAEAENAYDEYIRSGKKSRPFEDLMNELKL